MEDKQFICEFCNKQYKNNATLSSHKSQKHPAVTEEEKAKRKQNQCGHIGLITQKVTCKECGKECNGLGIYELHRIWNHGTDEEKEYYYNLFSEQQKEKMKDPELKERMVSGMIESSKNQSDEKRQKSAETMRRLRKEHPEWKMIGPEAYAKKMRELYPRTDEDYPFAWNSKLKKQIKERDNYKCIDCGVSEEQLKSEHRRMAIHHLDLNKQNLEISNLISVCYPCHAKRHHLIRKEVFQKGEK